MQRLNKALSIAVILSETSHVFCCVLPVVVSAMSLLAGAGVISFMPAILVELHDAIHAYEIPLIMFSGIVLLLGWGLHWLSMKMDCHDTGCCHGPCGPVKNKSSRILKIATILFVVNVSIYMLVHVPMNYMGEGVHEHAHGHEHEAVADPDGAQGFVHEEHSH